MGRFPVTLYKEQWLKLLDMSDDIRAFIAANEAQLKAKDQRRIDLASGLSGALKAHPDLIGDAPFEVAPPQRFTVER